MQIYHNGVWGTVCNTGWGDEEGAVVCRQLVRACVLLPAPRCIRIRHGPPIGCGPCGDVWATSLLQAATL